MQLLELQVSLRHMVFFIESALHSRNRLGVLKLNASIYSNKLKLNI